MSMNKYIISIDPSINFCGYAIHKNKSLVTYGLIRPSSKQEDFVAKSKDIINKIKTIISQFPFKGDYVYRIVIELPQYFGVAGFMARESGAIPKLMFLCGMIVGLKNNVVLLTPNDWKGQLPKDVVNNRLRKIYSKVDIANLDHNIVDAIGIGHYYINTKVTRTKLIGY